MTKGLEAHAFIQQIECLLCIKLCSSAGDTAVNTSVLSFLELYVSKGKRTIHSHATTGMGHML